LESLELLRDLNGKNVDTGAEELPELDHDTAHSNGERSKIARVASQPFGTFFGDEP
jgi:hypothetical protein